MVGLWPHAVFARYVGYVEKECVHVRVCVRAYVCVCMCMCMFTANAA